MVLATMLYRASHLAVGVMAVVKHQRTQPVQWAALALALGFSVLLYGRAWYQGWFSRSVALADVLVVGCGLPFLTHFWGGAQDAASLAWTMLLGGSSSAAAIIALRRWAGVGAVLLIAALHAVGYLAVEAAATVTLGHLNALASSAALAAVFWRYLCRQGTILDEAIRREAAAERERARYAERIAHHRALHDTVLATLTAIAAGSVDANSQAVRRRCANEAAYLRRLIDRNTDSSHPGIAEALEDCIRMAESLKLRVSARFHQLTALPAHVTTAVVAAVTEALNNVRRHSGSDHAFLTATGQHPEGVTVIVVDQGRGFAPDQAPNGVGLRHSVYGRMAEIDGWADVDSNPGEGVRVELRWPA